MAPVDQYNMRGWIVAGAALLLPSCLELEGTITIRPDGTGTQALSMKISREMFAEPQQQVTIASGGESVAAIAGVFDKKQATAEFAAAGLTVDNHEVKEKRSSQTLDLEVSFPNLKSLAASPLGGGRSDWILLDAGEGKTAMFFYPMGKEALKKVQRRIRDLDKQPSEQLRAFFMKRRAEIAGLDLTLTINLPGEVCKKSENLSVEKQSTQVIARITAASIQAPRDLLALLAPCYVAEFDSRLCTW